VRRTHHPPAHLSPDRRQLPDITVAAPLLCQRAPSAWLIGDKGYDADHLRALLDSRGSIAVIRNKTNRKRLFPFDAERYKWRNVIARTNCRIKDFRAISTRYDKLARTLKNGRTRLAYTPEHAVDLDTGVVVAAALHPSDEGTTIERTLAAAEKNLAQVGAAPTNQRSQRASLTRRLEDPKRPRGMEDAHRRAQAAGLFALARR
jgi:transposase